MFVERSTQYTSFSSRKPPANAGTGRKQFTANASVAHGTSTAHIDACAYKMPSCWPRWRSLLVTSQGSSSATTYKLYFILREDQRLSTKGKIVSKYCNISETPRRDSINPLPLYHGGGMNLPVRPIVNKSESEFHGFPVLPFY